MLRCALAGLALIVLGFGAVAALHLVTAQGDTMFAGRRPGNLGVTDGRLAPCGRRLNCVSSQADPSDTQRYVAPLRVAGGSAQALTAARRAVEAMPGAKIVRQEANYLHAEFRSRLMGFVDDVELSYEAAGGVLHVRSASRLGRRDFGVNRKRVEALRARIAR